jgi:hypothetical protein
MTLQKAARLSDTVQGAFDQKALTEGGQAIMSGIETWFEAATECQREMAGFVSDRLAKDSDTLREMLASKTPSEVMELHARWLQDTFRDYGAELTKMFAIYTKHTAGAVPKRR